MIIICPKCDKRYNVADDSLGTGRKVKCKNCGHRWFAAPPADELDDELDFQDADQPANDEPSPVEASEPDTPSNAPDPDDAVPPEPEEPPKVERETQEKSEKLIKNAPRLRKTERTSSRAGLFGWLLLVVIILGLAGLVLGRNEIVALYPKSADFYRMVGLPVTVHIGLEIRDIESSRDSTSDLPAIVIAGNITNVSDQPREVPAIRVALLDGQRVEIEYGLFDPPQRELTAGGSMRFEARLIDPPASARNYLVTFESSTGPNNTGNE